VLVVPPVRRAERPERRPVAEGGVTGDVRHLDAAFDAQDAAGCGFEVGAPGLDAGGGPLARGALERRDAQVSGAVEAEVGGVVGVALDLTGAPVGGTAGVAVAGVDDPVVGGGQGSGRAVEVVGPDQGPAGGRGRYGGARGGRGRERGHGRRQQGRHGGERRARPSASVVHGCPFKGWGVPSGARAGRGRGAFSGRSGTASPRTGTPAATIRESALRTAESSPEFSSVSSRTRRPDKTADQDRAYAACR